MKVQKKTKINYLNSSLELFFKKENWGAKYKNIRTRKNKRILYWTNSNYYY